MPLLAHLRAMRSIPAQMRTDVGMAALHGEEAKGSMGSVGCVAWSIAGIMDDATTAGNCASRIILIAADGRIPTTSHPRAKAERTIH